MSQIVREGFAQFCKRQKAGLLLIGEIQKQEKKDQEALLDVQEKRFERKYNLFYENLDATALTNFRSDGTAVRYRCKGDAMNSYKTVSGELSLDSVTLETSDGVDNLVIKPASPSSFTAISDSTESP